MVEGIPIARSFPIVLSDENNRKGPLIGMSATISEVVHIQVEYVHGRPFFFFQGVIHCLVAL